MRLWPFGKKSRKQKQPTISKPSTAKPSIPEDVPSRIEDSLGVFRRLFEHANDFKIREIVVGRPGTRVAVLHIEGLADRDAISERIMKDAMLLSRITEPGLSGSGRHLIEQLEHRYLAYAAVMREKTLDETVIAVLKGDTVVLVDGADSALVLDTKGWPSRGVEEPATETVIRGPRDGFTESMRTNITHVRRRLRTPHLAVREVRLGKRSQTDTAILWMTDVSDPHVVEEVNRRLDSIDIDGILEAGQLEQLISDSPLSIFPLVERTERPDKVAASLLEGRVAVVVDNSPHVLLMPVSAWVFIQASDDYYENVYLSSAVRLLRFVAFMAATFSTAAYVAAVGYHQELVPLSLLLRIVATHEGIPFGTLITALLMEVAVEILREAGVRLPRPIGVAVSIVGALIIGDAAVTAGFAPPGMVIIVAFATIASFAIPGYGLAIAFRLLRFPIIIASGLLGLFGLGLSAMFLLAYACSLTSVGYPYFEFLSPNYTSQLTDKLAVFPPQYRSRRRPQWSQGSDKFRQGIPRGYPPVLTSNRNNEHSEGDEAQDEPAKNKEQHD